MLTSARNAGERTVQPFFVSLLIAVLVAYLATVAGHIHIPHAHHDHAVPSASSAHADHAAQGDHEDGERKDGNHDHDRHNPGGHDEASCPICLALTLAAGLLLPAIVLWLRLRHTPIWRVRLYVRALKRTSPLPFGARGPPICAFVH